MFQRTAFLSVFLPVLLLLSSCEEPEFPHTADLTVVTANIFIKNPNPAEAASDLLAQDGDIYLLHEAFFQETGSNGIRENFASQRFIDAGYALYRSTGSTLPAFNGVLASRLPVSFGEIDLVYNYAHGIDVTAFMPFYAATVMVEERDIALIGAHIPPEIFMPREIQPVREKAFTDLAVLIQNVKMKGISPFVLYARSETGPSRWSASLTRLRINDTYGSAGLLDGADVILGGDLNTLPSDTLLDEILGAGMEDAILKNKNLLDFTWTPKPGFIPYSARIDYCFVSENLETVFQESFIVSGSDHKGLKTGVNIR